jgi:hypothetical protein
MLVMLLGESRRLAWHSSSETVAKRWLATDPLNADRKTIQTTIVREWKNRWQREVGRSRARHRGRAEELADEPPTKERLKLHDGLQKAESSLLIQMRTGKIGLRAFLFERQVPDVMTPVCACGDGRETARHVAAYCQLEEITRRELPYAMRTHRDFDTAAKDLRLAGSVEGFNFRLRPCVLGGRSLSCTPFAIAVRS